MPKPSGSTVTMVPTIRKACLYRPNSSWDSVRTSTSGNAMVNAKPAVFATSSQNAWAVSDGVARVVCTSVLQRARDEAGDQVDPVVPGILPGNFLTPCDPLG